MNPTVHDYTKADLRGLIPPMPDFYCRQADGVYALQPLTAEARRFVADRDDLYQADELRFRGVGLFDAIFDAGLSVV